MPIIDEVKKGTDIGKNSNSKYIWAACIDCGKERWVQIRKEQYPRCSLCAMKICHPKGDKSKLWLGRKYKSRNGYIVMPLSPSNFFYLMTTHRSAVLEHRLVMAKHLNRCLLAWEIVHHRNGIKDDNRLENLELIQGNYKHNALTKMNTELKHLTRRLEEAEYKIANQDKMIRLLKFQLKECLKVGAA